MLELKSAQARYHGVIALQAIDLTIRQGEKLALVGRSGSGKSTLLNLIFERFPEDAALVPQDSGLVQTLSVFHNVYMGRLAAHSVWSNLLNLVRPQKKEMVDIGTILQQLQLEDKLFSPVGKLSGGQKQRTAIARSLYQGGALLLADEPVSAVDEHQSREVMETLCGAFSTVVLAMHDIDLALDYCDRILGLQAGKCVLDQPSHDLTRADLLPLYRD